MTARFLLLFALLGTFVPLALAATAAPPHACCIRKAAHLHQCHGADPEQRVVRSTECCNRGHHSAVTTSGLAHPQPLLTSVFAHHAATRVFDSPAELPAGKSLTTKIPRAPPQVSSSNKIL
jgi:hypothetical protein